MVELDDYLRRLQLSGAPELTAAGLSLIHERHLETIPFENLDILAGREISLEIEAVLAKTIVRRRGGFCYELNSSLHWLLKTLGFAVDFVGAEVADADGNYGMELGHLALVVTIGAEKFLCDVGFGTGFLTPLDLNERDEINQRTQSFQFQDDGDFLVLNRYEREAMGYRPLYRFSLTPRPIEDFAEPCRLQATAADSRFTQELFCTIAAPDGWLKLTMDELVITRNRRSEVTKIETAEDREREFKRYFGILPD